MDQVVRDTEELQLRRNKKRTRDFQSDMDIVLLMSTINLRIYFLARHLFPQIQRPIRRPTTTLGHDYIKNVLKEDADHFWKLYRMYPDVFLELCKRIRSMTSLRDTRWISVEEMLATFLLIVGQSSRFILPQDVFKRSSFAISESFNKILRALNTIAPSLLAQSGNAVPSKIRESTRFYPYFKVCKKLFYWVSFSLIYNKNILSFSLGLCWSY